MSDFITCKELLASAESALQRGMDYLIENRIYSVWSGECTGWQEMWMRSKFSGLYATTNALTLLCKYYDRYENEINAIIDELDFLFDFEYYTQLNPREQIGEDRYKRCKFLYDQNVNTTLKAIYFYRANLCIKDNAIAHPMHENHDAMMERVIAQIKESYQQTTGFYRPSVSNDTDVSMMTTAQAHIIATELPDMAAEDLKRTETFFTDCLRSYNGLDASYADKFERYTVKRNLIAAVYALSHTYEALASEDKELLLSVLLELLNDHEFRCGFMIKDSYMVSGTVESRDAYVTDSRILLLDSVLTLMLLGALSPSSLDLILDDMMEMVECVSEHGRYLAWDMNPSFSHNIKALKVLELLTQCLKKFEITAPIINIHPATAEKTAFRTMLPSSCVVFMPFTAVHSDSFYVSVQEVLSNLGCRAWCARNDPYGVDVIENIWGALNSSAFVIADCTTRSANVMYEVGLSHGLGKAILLCAPDESCLPYESALSYDFCKYNPNGAENPPPYEDLQAGILDFLEKHINDICLSDIAASEMKRRIEDFKQYYLED